VDFKLSKNRSDESLACLNEKILNRQICHVEKWWLRKVGEIKIKILLIMIVRVITGAKTQYRFWQSLRSSQKQPFAPLTYWAHCGVWDCSATMANP
jgi:hypothetical protein